MCSWLKLAVNLTRTLSFGNTLRWKSGWYVSQLSADSILYIYICFIDKFPNRSLIEARLRMLPLQQRHGGRKGCVEIISHPKTDESKFSVPQVVSEAVYVFISQFWQACGCKSAACLFVTVRKTTGPNMFVNNDSGTGHQKKKEEDRKQLSGRFSAVTLSVCGKDKEAALQKIAGK